MQEIIKFAESATPLAILAMAVAGLVYVVYKTYRGENQIDKISDVQDEKYPLIEDHIRRFNELDRKLEKIANNHLHELPDMMKSIGRIENKVDRIEQTQVAQGQDIAVLKDFKNNIRK
jgi:hypothetical protein